MHIHILGICGTFMGGVAVLAKEMGYEVSGSDENVYPPMSDALREAGIDIHTGYDPAALKPAPDRVVIGNTVSRGNPAVEYVLNQQIPYISGPQWLADHVLQGQHVLAVSGTHGKTTTSSILAWLLTHAGLNPGYLIGGVAQNFEKTALLGDQRFFVIEADEYDSAFFDKRSKFIHYHPRTLMINNIEFDHADIFADLEAIKKQFQNLIKTVPGCGTIIMPTKDVHVSDVMERGCWSNTVTLGAQGVWHAEHVSDDGSAFELWHRDQKLGDVQWGMLGLHNVNNALAAVAAAHDVGVTADTIIEGLQLFKGVKRRLEVRGVANGITVYDDFAHHPTAIATTLEGLRARIGQQRLIAVLQFGSNTMRMGEHQDRIASALQQADDVILLQPTNVQWDVTDIVTQLNGRAIVHDDVTGIVRHLESFCQTGDHVVVMSNKGFDGIHQRLLDSFQLAM